jgi:hypothetical protein
MADGAFHYEDCLLKHHIRKNVWLPLCLGRRDWLKRHAEQQRKRRLKYFTFCAIGAIDVFMLLLEKVLKKSKQDQFDTVVFFERDELAVLETQKRIPGAVGFPGDFVEIVILDDEGPDSDPLEPSDSQEDTILVRENKRKLAQRRQFVECFPFDVINLDLQDFLFKPRDEIPGKLVNALRRIFEWQKLPLTFKGSRARLPLQEFSFMFTTRVGPANMTAAYRDMLVSCLEQNIIRDGSLEQALRERSGGRNPAQLLEQDFERFFKIAMPKILVSLVDDSDWYIAPDNGIRIFEFERVDGNGPYQMLHIVADIKRKIPPQNRRAPGTDSPVAQKAYAEVVTRVISESEELITLGSVNADDLRRHLDRIKGLRRTHYPG